MCWHHTVGTGVRGVQGGVHTNRGIFKLVVFFSAVVRF